VARGDPAGARACHCLREVLGWACADWPRTPSQHVARLRLASGPAGQSPCSGAFALRGGPMPARHKAPSIRRARATGSAGSRMAGGDTVRPSTRSGTLGAGSRMKCGRDCAAGSVKAHRRPSPSSSKRGYKHTPRTSSQERSRRCAIDSHTRSTRSETCRWPICSASRSRSQRGVPRSPTGCAIRRPRRSGRRSLQRSPGN